MGFCFCICRISNRGCVPPDAPVTGTTVDCRFSRVSTSCWEILNGRSRGCERTDCPMTDNPNINELSFMLNNNKKNKETRFQVSVRKATQMLYKRVQKSKRLVCNMQCNQVMGKKQDGVVRKRSEDRKHGIALTEQALQAIKGEVAPSSTSQASDVKLRGPLHYGASRSHTRAWMNGRRELL